ncbi:fructose-1,6-bisphosphatase [Leptolyngbya sp. 15MV]|nr:fructose-1,6-bisphosphatase [Leptolyngbya sp. 15MV]
MTSSVGSGTRSRTRFSLPRGVVHVVSDVHGESAKLRHVINNASGALRQLVDQTLGERLPAEERARFLAVLYYPREAIDHFSHQIVASGRRLDWVFQTLSLQFEIVRKLRVRYRRDHFERLVLPEYRELFLELGGGLRPDYVRAMLRALAEHDRDWAAVRAGARLVRSLAIDELLVLGDVGDRGPRIDRVIDIMMNQPRCSVVWGNHDMLWIGSHLGHEPSMLTTLRFSIRYRVAAQLEEGYGIPRLPLERLVQECYADDPADCFRAKGEGLRDPLMVARMQKAVSVMLFKSEGQMFARRPAWGLEHRRLLHRIDLARGVIRLPAADGSEVEHPLLDRRFPTINPADPYAFSPEERACLDRLRESFVSSQRLREQMEWLVRHGSMWTRRDDVLLFHACVPVDERGTPLELEVDGVRRSGRDLFDALGSVVRRAMRKRWFAVGDDADWIWYLWGGSRSPLFGKDKLATFESHLIADKATHKEHKNPYFDLMHDPDFIRSIGRMFGMGDDVLVVNGHVPVKIEKGEQPIKRGGNAITIDGAFSAAYGDRGYTLVIQPDRVDLAELAPFEGVEKAIQHGADIVPKMTTVRRYPAPKLIADSQDGSEIVRMIADLESLIEAYREGMLRERDARPLP